MTDTLPTDHEGKSAMIIKGTPEMIYDAELIGTAMDECQRSYVSLDRLQELRDKCQAILDTVEYGETEQLHPQYSIRPIIALDQKLAMETLPPTEGFFFGDTEIGEWYVEDLQRTVDQITPLLDLAGLDFYYQSSW